MKTYISSTVLNTCFLCWMFNTLLISFWNWAKSLCSYWGYLRLSLNSFYWHDQKREINGLNQMLKRRQQSRWDGGRSYTIALSWLVDRESAPVSFHYILTNIPLCPSSVLLHVYLGLTFYHINIIIILHKCCLFVNVISGLNPWLDLHRKSFS